MLRTVADTPHLIEYPNVKGALDQAFVQQTPTASLATGPVIDTSLGINAPLILQQEPVPKTVQDILGKTPPTTTLFTTGVIPLKNDEATIQLDDTSKKAPILAPFV